jgi:hypothetical protein
LVPAASSAFDILAKIERDGNGIADPSDSACTFCINRETRVSTSFTGGFPPNNSEIGGMAFVDLATGVMRGNAHAVSNGISEQHELRFVNRLEESVEVEFPPGLPADQRFVTLTGEVQGGAAATNRASGRVLFSLQLHNLAVQARVEDGGVWEGTGGDGDPTIEITPVAMGYQFRLTRFFPNGGVVSITSQLEGTAWAEGTAAEPGIGDARPADTASLGLVLPPGATYTSTTDVFLTTPPGPAIAIARSGADAAITYSGTLQSSPTMTSGSWAPVVGATSPYQFPVPAGGFHYYRAASP